MGSPQNMPPEEEPKKRSDEYWTGLAFLPIGITFFILGLTNPTYLAVGLPFLTIALVMMTKAGREEEDDADDEEDTPTPSTDGQNPRTAPPA